MRIFIRWLQAKVRDYFGFSAVETNGTLFLLTLMVLVTFVPMAYRRLAPKPTLISTADQRQLDSLIKLFPLPAEDPAESNPSPRSTRSTRTLFPFDPNTADQASFERLGLPDWLGERIIKYRQAGGNFRIKSDLSKIYGVRDQDYARLAPYIQLPEVLPSPSTPASMDSAGTATEQTEFTPARRYKPLVVFDANVADTTQWKRVYGIGTKLSARIVKFRDALGGFVNTQQLGEVYGLSPEVLAKLDSLVFIAEEYIPVQLAINRMAAEELAGHPYLSTRQARALVAYRDQHGAFSEESFLQVLVLKEEERQRLLPYLNFDPAE